MPAAFFGSTPALLFDAILNTDPIPPRTINPAIPARLEEIILAMLEKDPDLRLQSADAVQTEFRRLQRDMEQGRAGIAGGRFRSEFATHVGSPSPVRLRVPPAALRVHAEGPSRCCRLRMTAAIRNWTT